METCNLPHSVAVVTDPTTYRVLGHRVLQQLRSVMEAKSVVLPDHPKADVETVASIREATFPCKALVAVGSGTINDLCKYSAHLTGKPYVVFGTAPSMNGYTSVNASITVGGQKKTLPASGPVGAFFDLGVMAAAPKRMLCAGLGDSICRVTAQADWLLAHLLFDRPYRTAPFMLLAEDEEALLANSGGLASGDLETVRSLVRTLILSGFGMALCAGSYPASGGEHLIGHYLEMLGDPAWPEALHGERIAVATLAMARIQGAILESPVAPKLSPADADEAAVIARFGSEIGPACWEEFKRKRLEPSRVPELSSRLAERWPRIRSAIGTILQGARNIGSTLRRAGAPMTAADIHVPIAAYREAVLHAREIRDRYTFLDLAAATGRLARLAASCW